MDLSLVIAAALATPLLVSLVLNAWAGVWGQAADGPLTTWQRRVVTCAEGAAVVLLLFQIGGSASLVAASLLYMSLAAGVALLLLRKGAIPCGCWGAHGGRLSWRLVSFDAGMAALSGLAALFPSDGVRDAALSLATLAALMLVVFVAGIGIPDLRHALRGVRPRAQQEYRWYRRFPDLEEA